MIEVGDICVAERGKTITLECNVEFNGCVRKLWFSTESKRRKEITLDRCDSFFVPLVMFALFNQSDIRFRGRVSKRLRYGVTEILIPALISMNPGLRRIAVECTVCEKVYFEARSVGTAMSLGVDSFFSLYDNEFKDLPITHLTLFNAGAYGHQGDEKTNTYFSAMASYIKGVANELGLDLISVDTNLSSFVESSFVCTHTINNVACALLFQPLFRYYFYGSGYTVKEFSLMPGVDAAQFDLLTVKALATESFEVEVSGLYETRLIKTELVSTKSFTYDKLSVCVIEGSNKYFEGAGELINCSRCHKCIKTMVTLDVLGVLEQYSKCFDIQVYEENRSRYLSKLLYGALRGYDKHAKEIIHRMKKMGYNVPPIVYWYTALIYINKFFSKLGSFSLFRN